MDCNLLLKLALGYEKKRFYQKAEEIYQQILLQDPHHIETLFEYGSLLAVIQLKFFEASKLLEQCLLLQPHHSRALGLYAEVMEHINPIIAKEIHQRAYQMDHSIQRLRSYASFLEKIGEFEEAEEVYKEGLEEHEGDKEESDGGGGGDDNTTTALLCALASLYEDTDRDNEAIRCYQQALAIDRNCLEGIAGYALHLFYQGDERNDLLAAKEAVELLERIPPDERHDLERTYLYSQALVTKLEGLGDSRDGHCAQCGGMGSLRCKKCNKVSYCGKECQGKHWQRHKKICGKVLPHPSEAPLHKVCPVCRIDCDCHGPLAGEAAFGIHAESCMHTMLNVQNEGIGCPGNMRCIYVLQPPEQEGSLTKQQKKT